MTWGREWCTGMGAGRPQLLFPGGCGAAVMGVAHPGSLQPQQCLCGKTLSLFCALLSQK